MRSQSWMSQSGIIVYHPFSDRYIKKIISRSVVD